MIYVCFSGGQVAQYPTLESAISFVKGLPVNSLMGYRVDYFDGLPRDFPTNCIHSGRVGIIRLKVINNVDDWKSTCTNEFKHYWREIKYASDRKMVFRRRAAKRSYGIRL